MKKLFLFTYLACIAAYVGYSQMSLTLSDSTGQIPNNSTIVKNGTPTSDEIVTYLFVTNASTSAVAVLAKKVVIDTITGSYNSICWGSCFTPSIYVSPNPLTVNAGRTDSLDFSGHYVPNAHAGISHIRYVFFNRGNPLDSVCVNIAYAAFPLGMETLAEQPVISNAYPNPAGNSTTFSYSIPSHSSGSLIIRNLLGVVVREFQLNSGSGKLSVATDDLQEGVYFYSLNVNGAPDISRKLIVRH